MKNSNRILICEEKFSYFCIMLHDQETERMGFRRDYQPDLSIHCLRIFSPISNLL